MHVLVTGEKSYAGRQFEKRMLELNSEWKVDFVSVRNDEWKSKDFSTYDALYHVAAIVHQKEKKENEDLYFKINRDLTYELAVKAKLEGVSSFIFLSTMAVYGLIGKIGEDTIISKETNAVPTSYYGKSKLEAEELLNSLQSHEFSVSVLRIPMIYGPNCPGNYKSLSKMAKKTPFFPKISNKRSMIFVNHLSDVVVYIIKNKISGILLIKNPVDISTESIINEIAKYYNKRIYNLKFLGFLVGIFGNKFDLTRKIFGNLSYKDEDCTIGDFNFVPLSTRETIVYSQNQTE